MKKFDKGNIIAAILYVGIFIASYYISLGIVRLYARTVEPNTLEWHDVFVSLSPRAESHTGATMLLNSGVEMEIVSKVLGHSSTRMTRQIYAKLLDETVADAMSKVTLFTT